MHLGSLCVGFRVLGFIGFRNLRFNFGFRVWDLGFRIGVIWFKVYLNLPKPTFL